MNTQSSTPDSAPETHSTVTAQAATGQAVRIQIDDSQANAVYANLCFVSCTPEEVILDFALNKNPAVQEDLKVTIGQRVVMSHYTAKRVAALLASTLQRHEKQFGPIEVDIRKRMNPQPAPESFPRED